MIYAKYWAKYAIQYSNASIRLRSNFKREIMTKKALQLSSFQATIELEIVNH